MLRPLLPRPLARRGQNDDPTEDAPSSPILSFPVAIATGATAGLKGPEGNRRTAITHWWLCLARGGTRCSGPNNRDAPGASCRHRQSLGQSPASLRHLETPQPPNHCPARANLPPAP